MIQRTLVSALVCVAVFCAQSAGAHSLRPHWSGSQHHDDKHEGKCDHGGTCTDDGPALQQILDGLVVSGPGIDANDATGIELWDNSVGPMTAQLVADYTGKSQLVLFGMYPDGDPRNRVFLLSEFSRPKDPTTVTFLEDGDLSIRGGLRRKASGFDGPFGFFVKVIEKHGDSRDIWFTDADLNGGEVRAKVFAGDGLTTLKLPGLAPGLFLPNQFLIAFETGCDGGFNDLLVLVTGIVPAQAPEPALAWLTGVSLAALCARRARRI